MTVTRTQGDDFTSLLEAKIEYDKRREAEKLARAELDAELVKAARRTSQAHIARLIGQHKVSVGDRLRFISARDAG